MYFITNLYFLWLDTVKDRDDPKTSIFLFKNLNTLPTGGLSKMANLDKIFIQDFPE